MIPRNYCEKPITFQDLEYYIEQWETYTNVSLEQFLRRAYALNQSIHHQIETHGTSVN